LRECSDHERLGQAGHAFKNAVPAGEEADKELIDRLHLPDDRPDICLRIASRARPQLRQPREVRVNRIALEFAV